MCVPSLGDLRGGRQGSLRDSELGRKRQTGARSHRGLEASMWGWILIQEKYKEKKKEKTNAEGLLKKSTSNWRIIALQCCVGFCPTTA